MRKQKKTEKFIRLRYFTIQHCRLQRWTRSLHAEFLLKALQKSFGFDGQSLLLRHIRKWSGRWAALGPTLQWGPEITIPGYFRIIKILNGITSNMYRISTTCEDGPSTYLSIHFKRHKVTVTSQHSYARSTKSSVCWEMQQVLVQATALFLEGYRMEQLKDSITLINCLSGLSFASMSLNFCTRNEFSLVHMRWCGEVCRPRYPLIL